MVQTIITDESVQKSAAKASEQMTGDDVERSFSTLSQLVGSGPISPGVCGHASLEIFIYPYFNNARPYILCHARKRKETFNSSSFVTLHPLKLKWGLLRHEKGVVPSILAFDCLAGLLTFKS